MSDKSADTLWYSDSMDVFLNRWFSNHEDARKSRESEGGFLLPYQRQFFVCESEAIRVLGLHPDDPDWERIGWDGARPVDVAAYQRLCEKREQAVRDELG